MNNCYRKYIANIFFIQLSSYRQCCTVCVLINIPRDVENYFNHSNYFNYNSEFLISMFRIRSNRHANVTRWQQDAHLAPLSATYNATYNAAIYRDRRNATTFVTRDPWDDSEFFAINEPADTCTRPHVRRRKSAGKMVGDDVITTDFASFRHVMYVYT